MISTSSVKENYSRPTASPVLVSQGFLLWLIINDFIFGTVIILGNGALLLAIFRDPCRCLRTPSVFLIGNLSVVDIFMGIVSYMRAVELIYMYNRWPDPLILNIIQYFIGAVSIFVAVTTLIAMAYERYIAIIRPLQYPGKITNKRTKLSIIIIWVNALVMSVLPVSNVRREIFLLTYCYSHFFIPSVVLSAVYFKIFKAVAQQKVELKQVRESLTVEHRRRSLERESGMLRTFVLVLTMFYFSFMPFFIRVHFQFFCSCRDSYSFSVLFFVTNEFLSVSSSLDPFLYAWRLPRFSRSFRACFRRRLVARNAIAAWVPPASSSTNRLNK